MTLHAKFGKMTPAERQALTRSIGLADQPYPAAVINRQTIKLKKGDRLTTKIDLGVIASNDPAEHLQLLSELPQDRVVGMLLREMSVPSLLPIQFEALLRRDPDNINRLMFIKGDPGSGKTHLAKLVGRVRSEKGPLIVDCGDRNISELLYETVLDAGEDFKSGLNSKLSEGQITGASRTELRKLGPAFTEASDGKGQIDWASVGLAHRDKQSDSEAAAEAYEILKKVSFLEGFDKAGSNALGMKMKEGMLIRAFREDREIILDEYNKSVQGTDGSMQGVLQFLVGMDTSMTVSNRLKIDGREQTYSFEFRRENMGAGFFVTITGNDTKDGVTTHDLSASAYSRIDPFQVPPMQLEDWKHRISQYMTGLPLSTLAAVYHDEAANNPQQFARTLLDIRTMGMTATEKAAVPEHHMIYLQNWQSTLEAVEKLASFYVRWGQLVDPDSTVFDPMINADAGDLQDVQNEVSPRYRDEVSIDFRQPMHDLLRAMKTRPTIRPLAATLRFNAGSAAASAPAPKPDMTETLGTRLEQILLERITMTTAGKPALQDRLLREAEDNGILPKALTEAKKSTEIALMRDLLNVDRWQAYGGAAHLRSLQMDILASLGSTDTSKLTLDDVAMAVERVGQLDESQRVLLVPNAGAKDIANAPLAGMQILDQANLPAAMKKEELLPAEAFLKALANPLLGDINLRALRSQAISASGIAPADAPAVQIAEGTSPSGYLMTTVGTAEREPIHLLLAEKHSRKLLVVPRHPGAVLTALSSAGYEVVVQDQPDSQQKLGSFLDETIAKDKMIPAVRQAYLLRNGDEGTELRLSEMLATSKTPAFIPVYATNRQKLEV